MYGSGSCCRPQPTVMEWGNESDYSDNNPQHMRKFTNLYYVDFAENMFRRDGATAFHNEWQLGSHSYEKC